LTKFLNKQTDASDVIKWLHQNISATKGKPLSVGLNQDGSIKLIETTAKLSATDKKKITDKYTDLKGKEIG